MSNSLLQGADELDVLIAGKPGFGGAPHRYLIAGFDASENLDRVGGDPITEVPLLFQNGPVQEWGRNGVTEQSLLAVLVDRLEAFQRGPYSCRENALALTKLQEAQFWLSARTAVRVSRRVEGTSEK